MAPKLKFLLGFLTVVALLSVFRFGSIIYGNLKSANTANISNSLPKPTAGPVNALTKDSDHDGLSDRDEILYGTDPYKPDTDGDGYLDGEEVATGHDPLDPTDNSKTRPGTSSIKAPNLTQITANLAVASIMDESGQISTSGLTPQTINNISQNIQTKGALSLFVTPVQDSDLKIGNDNSPAAIRTYLETVTPLFESNLMAPLDASALSFNSGPNSVLDFYQQLYQSLSLIEVPSSWKDLHKQALNLLNQLIADSKSLTDDQITQDPIKAVLALNQFRNTVPEFRVLLATAAQRAKMQNIPTNDTLLEILKKLSP